MNDLFSNLGNVVTTVCALGCFCVGGVVLVGGFFAIRVGGQFIPIIGDLFTGGRSEGGSDPVMAQGVSSRSAGNSIRQRAQLLKAQDPLGSPYQSQAYQAQSAPPASNMPVQRTEFPAFNAQAASPAPTGQTSLLPPTRATGQFGQIGRQPTAPQAAAPQGNNYPPMQPPANNYPPMQPPPAAPLGGIPRRPTLSTGRPVSPLDNTQGQNTSDLDMRFSTNEIPGLRNRRRRSGDQEIYDDQEDASGDAGILGGMENFLGGF